MREVRFRFSCRPSSSLHFIGCMYRGYNKSTDPLCLLGSRPLLRFFAYSIARSRSKRFGTMLPSLLVRRSPIISSFLTSYFSSRFSSRPWQLFLRLGSRMSLSGLSSRSTVMQDVCLVSYSVKSGGKSTQEWASTSDILRRVLGLTCSIC